jgi:glyoxylase-like metal-dependent hydrolase (beta-lactamase superfamily II)
VPVTRPVEHGDTVPVGDQVLEVVHLRGHTPGSIALVWRGPEGAGTHVFTGDSLFPGGPGRTTSPENFTSLMNDLEARLFGQLDDATWLYPGHGKDSTIGAERPHLAEWRERGW